MQEERCDLLCLDLSRAEELRVRRIAPARAREAAVRAHALADRTRLTLAVALGEGGEVCVCDLAWILEHPQNLVSHHLRALWRAGSRALSATGRWFCTS